MELPLEVYMERNTYSLVCELIRLSKAPKRLARLVSVNSTNSSLKRALRKWSASSF